MKFQFVEALLSIAVALSLFDWSNRNDHDGRSLGTTYLPTSILQSRVEDRSSIVRPTIGTSTKEDETIIDSIINWEENQRLGRFRQNTNLYAYPIVSQNPVIQNYDAQLSPYSSSSSQIGGADGPNADSDRLPSPASQPSSASSQWPSSPGSSFDDGELFGAVGYTPQNSAQYFDIDSFLDGSFSSPSTTNTLSPFEGTDTREISSPNWLIDESSMPQESVDDLAQFLQASIESPDADEHIQKDIFAPGIQNYPEYLQESLYDLYLENKQAIAASSPNSDFPIDDKQLAKFDDILGGEIFDPTHTKTKESPFADIQSYRDPKNHNDQPMLNKRKVKKEISSPFQDKFYKETKGKRKSFDQGMDDMKFIDEDCKKIWKDLPYTKDDIIEMDIEKFSNIIASLDPLRQHVAKDIRRRGKNKLAARNCRKRKVEAVDYLGQIVGETEQKKQDLLNERLMLEEETAEIKRKTAFLYEHIFKNLRDERGHPYSHDEYALTYTAEGSVFLVPRSQKEKDEIRVR